MPFKQTPSLDKIYSELNNFNLPVFLVDRLNKLTPKNKKAAEDIFSMNTHVLSPKIIKKLKSSLGKNRSILEWHENKNTIYDIIPLTENRDGIYISLLSAKERIKQSKTIIFKSKMEAVGKLAGGIAHDFNNRLTAILGSTDLIERNIMLNSKDAAELNNIKKNAIRASELVKQLLAFSREQVLLTDIVDLDKYLIDALSVLTRMVEENITIETNISKNLDLIILDKVQVDQILINLAINAKDSMPFGGKIYIELNNIFINKSFPCRAETVAPGKYVEMIFEDTGTGLDEEVIEKMFDPFFTTKDEAKGSGLGLSVVDGIMRQSGGFVFSDNSKIPLRGASIRLLFPSAGPRRNHNNINNNYKEEKKEQVFDKVRAKDKTILLVEDEKSVLDIATKILENHGFRVLAMQDPFDALESSKKNVFDLLITDIVMPGMNGNELYKKISQEKTEIPTIFVSGYAKAEIRKSMSDLNDTNFLSKPFNVKELLQLCVEMLY